MTVSMQPMRTRILSKILKLSKKNEWKPRAINFSSTSEKNMKKNAKLILSKLSYS